jgi:hypothetical protein
MTPKEKAEDLFKKYIELSGIFIGDYESEKEMCLIAINEVQQLIKDLSKCKNRFIYLIDEINYWNEVKQEIQNL